MLVEKMGYGILFVGILVLALIPIDSSDKIEQVKYCRIDSITSKPRYEIMPQLDYTYHTSCGPIPAGNTKYQVGDSIEIKIIINEVDNEK